MESVIITISKYLLILLFGMYTLYCFTLFQTKNTQRQMEKYKNQRSLMFLIHFLCYLILFIGKGEWKYIALYLVQLVYFLVFIQIYQYVYKHLSRLVLNNMIMCLIVGLVMITRLNFDNAVKQFLIVVGANIVCLIVPYIIDKFKYFNKLGWVYAIVGIALLALVFVIGSEQYGATNWIVIGKFEVQPSEFVKIIYVFFVAAMFAENAGFKQVVKVGIVAAVHVMILVLERDLGAALIYTITFLVILYVASQKTVYLFGGLAVGSVAAAIAYKLFTHVQVRVTAFRYPWEHIDNEGYQITQSLFAIGTGGWFGMGLGKGNPKSIPVVESDFIFSAISEELGAFFALCLILVCLSCFVMFVNIALKMRRPFYKLVAIGLSTIYIFQIFLSIGGVTNFIPSTGVTLPLVSYGGSSVLSTSIMFSVIQGMYELNVDEVKQLEKESQKQKRGAKLRGKRKENSGKNVK